jgi:hypothetical protein
MRGQVAKPTFCSSLATRVLSVLMAQPPHTNMLLISQSAQDGYSFSFTSFFLDGTPTLQFTTHCFYTIFAEL